MGSGLIYSAVIDGGAILAADGDLDIFEFTPADEKPIEILSTHLTVYTELGDAAEEILRLKWIRGHATGGSGGATVTARPRDPRNTVTAGTVIEVRNDVIASAGTAIDLHSDGMNVRVPYVHVPIPEARIICTQAETSLVLRLMAAVADDLNIQGTVWFREGA